MDIVLILNSAVQSLPVLVQGAGITLGFALAAMVLGLPLGFAVALARLSRFAALRWITSKGRQDQGAFHWDSSGRVGLQARQLNSQPAHAAPESKPVDLFCKLVDNEKLKAQLDVSKCISR